MERVGIDWSRIAWGRLLKGALYACISVASAYLLQPWFHKNDSAFNVLITVFSILAGFIVVVTALVADDRALRGENWRQDVRLMKTIKHQLYRHYWSFQAYLAVLVLLFFLTLAPELPGWLQLSVEYAAIGVGMFVFLLSFSLPMQLMKRQIETLNTAIKDRRKSEDGPKR